MKILVSGGHGQLGTELFQLSIERHEWVFLGARQLDITNSESIMNAIETYHPDVIVNAAAYTAVDKAESEPEQAQNINAFAAGLLAKTCAAKNIKLLHISTDFVFGRSTGQLLTPDSDPEPMSVYGRTKLEGEDLVRKHLPSAIIARTSWLYSAHSPCFVSTMIRLMNERESLGIVCDQIGSPTASSTLANWIVRAIESELEGTFHISDAGVASWYDFALAIYELGREKGLIRGDCSIKSILTSDYPTPAQRPYFSAFDTSRSFNLEGLPKSKHWRHALDETLDRMVTS